MYPQPATFEDYKQHARRIDAVRRENEESRPKRDTIKPKPAVTSTTTSSSKVTATNTKTPLSASTNFVSPDEREKRRNENLCIKCGSPDHKFRECSNGWKKDRVAGKRKKKEETAKIAENPQGESESESEKE